MYTKTIPGQIKQVILSVSWIFQADHHLKAFGMCGQNLDMAKKSSALVRFAALVSMILAPSARAKSILRAKISSDPVWPRSMWAENAKH
jgi:hypothetical protein